MDTTDFGGLNDVDLSHLDRLLTTLRARGVTAAEFGPFKFIIALPEVTAPLTFEDIDRVEDSKPRRGMSPSDVKFPGAK